MIHLFLYFAAALSHQESWIFAVARVAQICRLRCSIQVPHCCICAPLYWNLPSYRSLPLLYSSAVSPPCDQVLFEKTGVDVFLTKTATYSQPFSQFEADMLHSSAGWCDTLSPTTVQDLPWGWSSWADHRFRLVPLARILVHSHLPHSASQWYLAQDPRRAGAIQPTRVSYDIVM